MPPLTDKQIAQHAKRLLDPMTKLVGRKMGQEAATHSGWCLFKALELYNSDRGDLDVYVKVKILKLVLDETRTINGRKGSAKYAGTSQSVQEFDSYDTGRGREVECPAEAREEFQKLTEKFGRFRQTPRFLIMGFSFGLNKKSLSRIIRNASERQIHIEAAGLRELLPVN